jgi:hypothetical protein
MFSTPLWKMHFAIGTGAFAHAKTYSSLLPLLEHTTTLHAPGAAFFAA